MVAMIVSNHRARFTRPVSAAVFPGCRFTGLRGATFSPTPIQCSPRAIANAIGWSRSNLRSTLHSRFYVQDSPIHPGPRGLHPQRADFQSDLAFVSSLATPTVCRTFQSFGALRNLPCAARQSVRAPFRCGISLRLSNKVGARASGPLWRFCLKDLAKCRAEPRAPTCECWRLSGG